MLTSYYYEDNYVRRLPMAESRARDLAPEVVQGLNENLEELRGLYVPKATALKSLHMIAKKLSYDFDTALTTGEPPERKPSHSEQLTALASSIPAILEQRAAVGTKSSDLMEKLERLLLSKKNGSPIEGTLNPADPFYTGDHRSVPRIFVASETVQGRVIDVSRLAEGTELPGARVWPTGLTLGGGGDWHSGRGGNPARTVNLLDGSVEFVEHIDDCMLPRPNQFDTQYQLTPFD